MYRTDFAHLAAEFASKQTSHLFELKTSRPLTNFYASNLVFSEIIVKYLVVKSRS